MRLGVGMPLLALQGPSCVLPVWGCSAQPFGILTLLLGLVLLQKPQSWSYQRWHRFLPPKKRQALSPKSLKADSLGILAKTQPARKVLGKDTLEQQLRGHLFIHVPSSPPPSRVPARPDLQLHHRLWQVCGQSLIPADRHEACEVSGAGGVPGDREGKAGAPLYFSVAFPIFSICGARASVHLSPALP